MSNDDPSGAVEFAPARLLRDVRFALLGAFELAESQCDTWQLQQRDSLSWYSAEDSAAAPISDFHAAEQFLLSKQLFFGRARPIPSFPPVRAAPQRVFTFEIRLANRSMTIPFNTVISYFRRQKVLTFLMYAHFDEISLDDLLFLKELKWYAFTGEELLSLDQNQEPVSSIHGGMSRILELMGADGVIDRQWPLFDFIELANVGPAAGQGPNPDRRLSIQEHWGLLSGDEGYRLIDATEGRYVKMLTDDQHRFHGRSYFLYQFFATSCISFLAENSDRIRKRWGEYYQQNVRGLPQLDAYIRLASSVPCLNDGIPLLVEVCLLRYIELCRVDAFLEISDKSAVWRNLIWRLGGVTPIEKAIALLNRLDLYQDSALWIIGGDYTDHLFHYQRIRQRIERTIAGNQTADSDIRLFFLATLTLVAGIIALFIH